MRRVLLRLGRRGVALLWFGATQLVYGFSLFYPAASDADGPSAQFLQRLAPLWAWGLLWLIPGLLCVVQAVRTTVRGAFAATAAVSVLQASVWLGVGFRWPTGLVLSALWFGHALFVAVVSGWPESPADDRHRRCSFDALTFRKRRP